MQKLKLKSFIVDTSSHLQNKEFIDKFKEKGKPKQDDWNDYGIDISNFFNSIRELGFTLVLVLGNEGRGKSYGMKALIPGSYLWFNADKKPATFRYDPKDAEQAAKGVEFKKWYGTISNPGPLMKVSTTANKMSFDQIIKQITMIKACVKTPTLEVCFDENPIAFVLAHSHMEKGPDGELFQKMRILGKSATKYGPEGLPDIIAICEINMQNGLPVHEFRIKSLGLDSARCPEGMFDGKIRIPNNYQLITTEIDEYYGFETVASEK